MGVFLLEPYQTLVIDDAIHLLCIESGSYKWKLKDCVAVHKIREKILGVHAHISLVPSPSFSEQVTLHVLIWKANEHSNAFGNEPCHV